MEIIEKVKKMDNIPSYTKRIILAIQLLQTVFEMSKDKDAKDDVQQELLDIQKYLGSDQMKASDDDEKNMKANVILTEAIQTSFPMMCDIMSGQTRPQKKHMDIKGIKSELVSSYLTAMEQGSDEIASLNINQWIQMNHIVVNEEMSSNSSN